MRRLYLALAFLICLLPLLGLTWPRQEAAARTAPRLFIIAGQSNMYLAQVPLAKRLAVVYPDCRIVTAAHGSVYVTWWQRGQWPYANALGLARVAIAQGAQPAAIIFQQGEQEAIDPARADEWSGWFWRFVTNFRADLGPAYANLPICYGILGNRPAAPLGQLMGWATVREQQLLALQQHPALRAFTLGGLTYDPPDGVHFSAASYEVMADRIMGCLREALQ